jgi:hypothetical protein
MASGLALIILSAHFRKNAECAKFSDKHLDKALVQIESGIQNLEKKYENI